MPFSRAQHGKDWAKVTYHTSALFQFFHKLEDQRRAHADRNFLQSVRSQVSSTIQRIAIVVAAPHET